MTLVTFEDQSPTMRRAKIRVVLAIVLLVVAIIFLIASSGKAPGKADMTAPQAAQTAPTPAPAAPVVATASKVESAKPAAPVAATKPKPEPEPEAKPPQAPPDPVYTSFTAEPAPSEVATAAEPDEAKAAPVKAKQAKPPAAPKVAQPKPVEQNPQAATGGSYLLQAGVFAEMANAQRQLEMLTQHQIEAHVECKVRIGPFANKDAVESAREKVSAAGIGATLEDYISSKGMMLQSTAPDMESAKQLQDSLTELGFSSRSETRILVGPYDTKAKADTMRNKIKALNISVVLM